MTLYLLYLSVNDALLSVVSFLPALFLMQKFFFLIKDALTCQPATGLLYL